MVKKKILIPETVMLVHSEVLHVIVLVMGRLHALFEFVASTELQKGCYYVLLDPFLNNLAVSVVNLLICL